MKIAATVTTALIVATVAPAAVSGFANPATKIANGVRTATTLHGYLDDLSKELYQPVDQPEGDDSHQATDLDKKQIDRYGVGNWNDYVEFEEFDGGDGQMGVAGDGNKGLEKFGDDVQPQLVNSKQMSAKNAWGKTTGYAETLIDQGMESVRAQQIENWRNQQEIKQQKDDHRRLTEAFENANQAGEMDWRDLAKFGVQRNQDFDLSEAFGAVEAGPQLEGVIELQSRIGQRGIFELPMTNPYMGFADFRAAFAPGTPGDFMVEPREGSLSKEPVNFIVKFAPNAPGVMTGYLVIETEDFKKTWQVVGKTA